MGNGGWELERDVPDAKNSLGHASTSYNLSFLMRSGSISNGLCKERYCVKVWARRRKLNLPAGDAAIFWPLKTNFGWI